MSLEKYDERLVLVTLAQILPADTTTFKVLIDAGGAGARFDAIQLSNSGVASHDVELAYYSGATSYAVGGVAVPAGAGYGELPPVDAVAALASVGMACFLIPPAVQLRARVTVAMGVLEALQIVSTGGYF